MWNLDNLNILYFIATSGNAKNYFAQGTILNLNSQDTELKQENLVSSTEGEEEEVEQENSQTQNYNFHNQSEHIDNSQEENLQNEVDQNEISQVNLEQNEDSQNYHLDLSNSQNIPIVIDSTFNPIFDDSVSED